MKTEELERVTSRVADEKRSFYRREDVAASYDRQRFGGESGNYVNERELRIVAGLLPGGGLIADVGSGTGRAAKALRRRGDAVIALDTSFPMLELTKGEASGSLPVQGDVFRLPLRGGACDGAIALRLLFHFPDRRPLLTEIRRIVKPAGTLVCDTYTWSPRALLPFFSSRWGARVSRISPARFRQQAEQAGWRVQGATHAFLFSPYLYRRLPLALVRALEQLEQRVPPSWLCRVFWQLEAV